MVAAAGVALVARFASDAAHLTGFSAYSDAMHFYKWMSMDALQPRLTSHSRVLAILCLLFSVALTAAAQPRETRRGDLVLRSSTVSSEQIDKEIASRHGIETGSNKAVLNVVLMRGKRRATIPAEVSATAQNLAGQRQKIDMREVRENDRVSYIGTYNVLPQEVVDLKIEARPLSPAKSRPLTLSYRERMRQG